MHIIFNAKCNSNPENEVGLMMMGGKAYVPLSTVSSPPSTPHALRESSRTRPDSFRSKSTNSHRLNRLTQYRPHSPEVLVTPTQDEGKLIAALHECKQGGDADLNTGIQVAQVSSPRSPLPPVTLLMPYRHSSP